MKIVIVGTGYVGLVTGSCLAEIGHKVTCIDIDKSKISSLRKSIVPFFEPGLEAIVKKQQKKNNLIFTSSYKSALEDCEAIFLCVGTPPKKNGSPNLSYLEQSLISISKDINRSIVIFIKSTVPVGTNKYAAKFFQELDVRGKHKVTFASNPEFLKEGDAVNDFKKPERIIIGTHDRQIKIIAKKIYAKLDKKKSLMQFCAVESAELIKYASNAFLATKISFINEISRLSDKVNADIGEIQRGMGADSRIGSKFLNAGLGFGGSCFPKDLDGLIINYRNAGLNPKISIAAKDVNKEQIDHFLEKIKASIELKNLNIMFWGLSFKPETDDIRESVGVKLIKKISSSAATIYAYDPVAMKNAECELKEFKNIKFIKSKYHSIHKCDILILATEWNEFLNPSIAELLKLRLTTVFDGRNILDKKKLIAQNIKYYGVGR
jgi:UDPglucose 6-dehydrogenase